MKRVEIYTDGGCWNHEPTKPGAWAVILYYKVERIEVDGFKRTLANKTARKEISGYAEQTTNNKMELNAAIMGLKKLKEPCSVTLYTDSTYVVKGITEWINVWQKNGWQTSQKKPVRNRVLWKELNELTERHEVKWEWVKGHNGNENNERCDELVQQEIKTNF